MKGASVPPPRAATMPRRGGFLLGFVFGLLLGLALALGVALYITKAPIPFINKVPGRTAAQDQAEAERNRDWDPNAPLAGRAASRPAAAGSAAGAVATGPPVAPVAPVGPAGGPPKPAGAASAPQATTAARDPAAILSGAPVAPPAVPTATDAAGRTSATPRTASTTSPGAAPGARSTAAPSDPFTYFVQAGAYARSEDAEQQKARLALLGHAARVTERELAGRTVYRVRVGPFPTRDEADSLQVRLQEAGVEAQIVRVEKP